MALFEVSIYLAMSLANELAISAVRTLKDAHNMRPMMMTVQQAVSLESFYIAVATSPLRQPRMIFFRVHTKLFPVNEI